MGLVYRTVLTAVLIAGIFPALYAETSPDMLSEALDPPSSPAAESRKPKHAAFRIHHQRLYITVTDDNGKAVPSAAVLLYSPAARAVLRAQTDFAGRCHFPTLVVGTYRLSVQKEGYYETNLPSVHVGQSYDVEVVLTRQKEVKEVVNVTQSPISIDPERTADTRVLNEQDIVNIPYANNRDYRAVLPYIPGVIQGPDFQPHIDGAHTYETLDTLDGFNVSQPVTGMLDVRVSS